MDPSNFERAVALSVDPTATDSDRRQVLGCHREFLRLPYGFRRHRSISPLVQTVSQAFEFCTNLEASEDGWLLCLQNIERDNLDDTAKFYSLKVRLIVACSQAARTGREQQ